MFRRLNTAKNGKPKPIDVKILLDGGASESIIMEKFTKRLKQKKCPKTVWKTQAGIFNTTHKVTTQFSLPELNEKCLIEYDMHVAPGQSAYDIIIGRDLLTELGIEMSFKEMTVTWDQRSINMKPHDCQVEAHYHIDDSTSVNEATDRIKEILDAKYEKADLAQVARECAHLTTDEQTRLLKILTKYEILFDGTLGKWTGDPYTIETRKDFKPYHARAYPIPRIHEKTLKMEVERLVQAGVLKKVNQSECAAPTFIIPKKDGTVRFISDFRELNKSIKRKPYPIPKIQDLMLKLEGFQYATSLDLNMGYYHIELCPDSKKLCTIVLPFGKYEYQRLPMGLCNSPDIFQEKMSTLMQDLEYVRAYIDDLLILTSST